MQQWSAVHVPWIIAHHNVTMSGCQISQKNRQDPVLVALGVALRQIRLEKSISQEKLALLAEVDRSYVGRVERGDNNVAVLTLFRLARAMDISMAEIMEQAGL